MGIVVAVVMIILFNVGDDVTIDPIIESRTNEDDDDDDIEDDESWFIKF